MKLVVDANILFSAILKQGNTRTMLLISEHDYYTPEKAIAEIEEHITEMAQKMKTTPEETRNIAKEIISAISIQIIKLEEIKQKEQEAEELCPDKDDVAYFALALYLNCPIWSNDKELKQQNKIRVISTKELIEEMQK